MKFLALALELEVSMLIYVTLIAILLGAKFIKTVN